MTDSSDLAAYYERRFMQGELYDALSTMLNAAHHRRMALLDALPIGDISSTTCVDYGVGSWGFANVYPRLHGCAKAIGIDVSATAVRKSEEVSRSQRFPYGDRVEYRTASGGPLPLDPGSVDVFFTGECIEHIENTDAFLDDVHRVLGQGGRLVLTTPNAAAIGYRRAGRRYGVGPEHVALMDLPELLGHLAPGFTVDVVLGYNTSLTEEADRMVDGEPTAAAELAALFEHEPALASGTIVLATRRPIERPRAYLEDRVSHHDSAIRRSGAWQETPLHEDLTGLLSLGAPGDRLTFSLSGTDLSFWFWTHDWSGEVAVDVDGRPVVGGSLFEVVGGFRRMVARHLPSGRHEVTVRPSGQREDRSHGSQVIFFPALGSEALPA